MAKGEVEIKVGDVWQSRGGRAKVKVAKVDPGSRWPKVYWDNTTAKPGTVRASGVCGLKRFPRDRTLIERDGKAVV